MDVWPPGDVVLSCVEADWKVSEVLVKVQRTTGQCPQEWAGGGSDVLLHLRLKRSQLRRFGRLLQVVPGVLRADGGHVSTERT